MLFRTTMALMAVSATVALAGGINTNTNQSASFLRSVARNASLDADAPYYNPAGTALMSDGWHISLNNQTFWQSRTTTAESPLFGGEKEFKGDAFVPAVPSLLATWHHGNLAISGMLGLNGGGGRANFKKGIPSFEAQLAMMPALLTEGGLVTTAYDADVSLKATSYIFGGTLGAAYQINNMFGVYLGARFNYVFNHYEGSLSDVRVNPKNELLGLDGSMVDAAATFNKLSQDFEGIAAQYSKGAADAKAAASQFEKAGDKASAAKYRVMAAEAEATAAAYAEKSVMFAGLSKTVSHRELDVEQTGWGITPIFGLAFKYNRLSVGAKLEYNTSIELENDTKINEVGLEAYDDGVKDHSDIPTLVALGLTYSVLDNVRLSVGYNHWFDSKANFSGKLEKYIDDTNEFLYGVEVDFLKRWTLSGGVQVTRFGLSDDYISDMNINLSATTFGFGLACRVTDWAKLNLGYFHSLYNDWEEDMTYEGKKVGTYTYSRDSRGFGIGVDLDL